MAYFYNSHETNVYDFQQQKEYPNSSTNIINY